MIDLKLEKLKLEYCIPLWLRDEQIKLSLARIKTRIEPTYELNDVPVAIVCYGPSLNDTWEQIKNFKYVFTCSGGHKFLIDRGIIPTWHVEVDPRPHKIDLIGNPHRDTKYLIASTCHLKVFDLLEGYDVKLWHVFADEEDAYRTLPPGEWALTGGSGVGLRVMVLARFLGFTNFHVFGMDGNVGKSGMHAANHPNQPKAESFIEYAGIKYITTPAMFECAKQTFHELNQLKDVKCTFYGDGLVQSMAKDYVPELPKKEIILAISKPELISQKYIELNKKLHKDNLTYGVNGWQQTEMVIKLAEKFQTSSILDYGCGKGYLAKSLPFPIWEYDPVVPGKEEPPRAAELVVCTNVLEHIEPEKLDCVLEDLRRCVKRIGFFLIHTGPSTKSFDNGENVHLIQENKEWWKEKLAKFFAINEVVDKGKVLLFLVGALQIVQNKDINRKTKIASYMCNSENKSYDKMVEYLRESARKNNYDFILYKVSEDKVGAGYSNKELKEGFYVNDWGRPDIIKQALKDSPDDVCFLDVDCIIQKPLEGVLDGCDVALTLRRIEDRYKLPFFQSYVNIGVMFFKNNNNSRKFLDLWKKFFNEEMVNYKYTHGQFCINKLLLKYDKLERYDIIEIEGIKVKLLKAEEYNFFYFPEDSSNAKIIHYKGGNYKDHPAIKQKEEVVNV